MNFILAVTCASITGATIGIAVNHKLSLPSQLPSPGFVEQDGTSADPHSSTTPNQLNSDTQVSLNSSTDSIHVKALETKIDRLNEQLNLITNQQSEFNRELNAIQFRLDTHSASFRPLRSERETEIAPPTTGTGITPLLPPRQ
ncbi:hypothetical protein [Rubritalea tangerina]|uniref:YbgF trimerisation domain-containing protein n=1 Tax=Rubritalea tangerina TaxID=430798 RepID=A0ABW4Z6A8_9BACT